MDEPLIQATCLAGLQAIGTLLGTMFGFVSAALMTPIHGTEETDGLPAAPGVIIGSSLGVLAAHSAGESNPPLRRTLYLLLVTMTATTVMTSASTWLVGDILRQSRSMGITCLAIVASMGATAVVAAHNHITLLRSTVHDEGHGIPSQVPVGGGSRHFAHGPKEV